LPVYDVTFSGPLAAAAAIFISVFPLLWIMVALLLSPTKNYRCPSNRKYEQNQSALNMSKGAWVLFGAHFINVFRIIRSPAKVSRGYMVSRFIVILPILSLIPVFLFSWFWCLMFLITRMYSAADVGYGSAIISVLNFLVL